MSEAEDIIFTRHADGSVTADHFPLRTRISVELLRLWNAPDLEITEIRVCGTRYRVVGKSEFQFAYELERVDDEGDSPHGSDTPIPD